MAVWGTWSQGQLATDFANDDRPTMFGGLGGQLQNPPGRAGRMKRSGVPVIDRGGFRNLGHDKAYPSLNTV